jgi:hypothetical protein
MTFRNPYRILHNSIETQYRRLCIPARTFAEIGNELYGQITEQTTPEQIRELEQSLFRIYKELEAQTGMLHYASSFGPPHTCLKDTYLHAVALLQNKAILQQPAPPPPTQQLISREGAVIDLEERAQTNSEETDLGTEDSPSDN